MEFNYRKLNAYQYALELVERVYEMVAFFPKEEKYSLGDQLRRAVVSVPSNIVEGMGRDSDKEKTHFISMAYTSLMEVMCQTEIALRVHYISEDAFLKIENEVTIVAKLLSGLKSSIQKSLNKQKSLSNKQ